MLVETEDFKIRVFDYLPALGMDDPIHHVLIPFATGTQGDKCFRAHDIFKVVAITFSRGIFTRYCSGVLVSSKIGLSDEFRGVFIGFDISICVKYLRA